MMKKWMVAAAGLLAIALTLSVVGNPLDVRAQDEFTYAGDVPAPEFTEGLQWLNVPEPLTMEGLRGKIVMLDFWTYGCINCIHIIPQLKALEEEFPNELVVIGVHSAKFEGEGVSDNIRQILQRYEVIHPVVNDADFDIWRTYGVRAWPTVGIIDPLGRIVGGQSGEEVYETFRPVIQSMVEEYGEAGLLDTEPIELTPEIDNLIEAPLSFPGSVLIDEAGDRLFIADSGHHRIVVTRLSDFEVLQIIGDGEEGLIDGDFDIARFSSPQGMELVDNVLFVADTNNHAIRAINFESGVVSLIAGTGERANFRLQEGVGVEAALRSPWDVTHHEGVLYIAMAGTHQLWQMDLSNFNIAQFAGNYREDLIDGPRLGAELAQPSGVVNDGTYVYFADSESSSIRRAGIAPDGGVETIIGPLNEPQGRLFDFGDIDGDFDEARLQHPLGVALTEDGELFITDTYNNKIKLIDVEEQTSNTFVGDVDGGYFDGNGEEALFDEPGGLAYSDGKLYVADTNNHAVRVIDIESRSVSSVIFPNVTVLLPQSTAFEDDPLGNDPFDGSTNSIDDLLASGDALVLDAQTVAPGEGIILVDAVMPFGYKLNAQAPFTAIWSVNDVATLPEDQLEYRVVTPELPIEFPVTFTEGQTQLTVDMTIYWCEAIQETLCFVERNTVVMPVTVSSDAVGSLLSLSYELVPPEVPENTFGTGS